MIHRRQHQTRRNDAANHKRDSRHQRQVKKQHALNFSHHFPHFGSGENRKVIRLARGKGMTRTENPRDLFRHVLSAGRVGHQQFGGGDRVDVGYAAHERGYRNNDLVVAVHPMRVGAPRLENSDDAKRNRANLDVGADRVFVLRQFLRYGLANDCHASRACHRSYVEKFSP